MHYQNFVSALEQILAHKNGKNHNLCHPRNTCYS